LSYPDENTPFNDNVSHDVNSTDPNAETVADAEPPVTATDDGFTNSKPNRLDP
jgi:hypothetical protein